MVEQEWDEKHTRIMTQTAYIYNDILNDVRSRRGWKQEYDQFDAEVREEIKKKWFQIIKDILYRN